METIIGIVDGAIHKGSCPSVSSGGTSAATHGGSSPCRDFMISVNPGGGVLHLLLGPPVAISPSRLGLGMELPFGL